MADEQRPRLISLTEVDGSDAAPLRVPLWRRVLCVLTGGHRVNRVIGLRYGVIVECGRCGWREARWNAALAMPKPAPGYHPGGRVDPPAGVALAPFAEVDLAPFQEAMSRTVRLLAEVTQLPVDLLGNDSDTPERPIAVAWGQPGGARPPFSMGDLQAICRQVEALPTPEPVKLTQGQMDALAAGGRSTPDYVDPLGQLLGVPIELVDTVEESTPYQLAQRGPERFATGGYIAGPPRDPSDDRIPALLSEGGCVQFWRGDHSGNHPLDEHPDDGPPDGEGATYPLVAPEDLQIAQSGMRGWLGRWIHRMRRTR